MRCVPVDRYVHSCWRRGWVQRGGPRRVIQRPKQAKKLTRRPGDNIFGSENQRFVLGASQTRPPGALAQRAAVFPCWGLSLTGRCPLLPQQTERPQTRARRAPGDACSGLRPAPLSGRAPRAGRRRRDRVTMNLQPPDGAHPHKMRGEVTSITNNTKLHKNHSGSASPNTTATTA